MNTIKNRVQIVGNVGSTPELKVINNKKLVKLSVAVNEYKHNTKGETRTKTQWHKITVWGKLAEQVQKLTQKGTMILIEGKLKTHTYIDKLGKKQSVSEIVANEIIVNYTPQAA